MSLSSRLVGYPVILSFYHVFILLQTEETEPPW